MKAGVLQVQCIEWERSSEPAHGGAGDHARKASLPEDCECNKETTSESFLYVAEGTG